MVSVREKDNDNRPSSIYTRWAIETSYEYKGFNIPSNI